MKSRLVCLCNMVTETELLGVLRKGARSTAELQKLTYAGTNCGRCLVVMDALVEEFIQNLPADPQQKINFGDPA